MAIVHQPLEVTDFVPNSTSGPPQSVVNGTNFPIRELLYDATTTMTATAHFKAINYGSGDVTMTVRWYGAATTGSVMWVTGIAAVAPGAENVETAAFGTLVSVATSVNGTTKYINTTTISITSPDSIAVNNDAWVTLARSPGNASDDMTGNAILIGAEISYSDT